MISINKSSGVNVTSLVVGDFVAQRALEVSEEVELSFPVSWSRVCLEAHEDAEGIGDVGAHSYLSPHAGAECFAIWFVLHVVVVFICFGGVRFR